MSLFRFKKFVVEQGRSAMKVNTDGVLLGSWMTIAVDGPNTVNDVRDAITTAVDSEAGAVADEVPDAVADAVSDAVANVADGVAAEGLSTGVAAWGVSTGVAVGDEFNMLDVGTGSGVIALMAAQRAGDILKKRAGEGKSRKFVDIMAIDIDEESLADAVSNFQVSPWGGDSKRRSAPFDSANTTDTVEQAESTEPAWRAAMTEISASKSMISANDTGAVGPLDICNSVVKLSGALISFQELAQREPDLRFDLIFSNPPFFVNSLKSADEKKSAARHTDTLSQADIIMCAGKLLKENGRLALILPVAEAEEFIAKVQFIEMHSVAGQPLLHLSRVCKVHTVARKEPKRLMLEFIYGKSAPAGVEYSSLVIQENGGYTKEYLALTRDFYLFC